MAQRVEVESATGEKIYIDPDCVVGLEETNDPDAPTLIRLRNSIPVVVKDRVDDVCEKLAAASPDD